jgi:nitric oxide reductase NorQ protein
MARGDYIAIGGEVAVFESAARARLPVMLKGPTGCGKTRLVEHMAKRLGRSLRTVACHEDLTAADLIGRYLLKGGETVWMDGPLTQAVKEGGICYLDEIVEARADTTVVLHPLADHRRELSVERLGEVYRAPAEFMLVISYNPGYQSVLKDLKASTRQRMVAIELGYAPPEIELKVLQSETRVDEVLGGALVKLAQAVRELDVEGLPEVASTRTLISAGLLIDSGLAPRAALRAALALPLSDDDQVVQGLQAMIDRYIPQ